MCPPPKKWVSSFEPDLTSVAQHALLRSSDYDCRCVIILQPSQIFYLIIFFSQLFSSKPPLTTFSCHLLIGKQPLPKVIAE